jgi:hypothetical protein
MPLRRIIKKLETNLAIRRAIVRAAEEECYRRGVRFMGRAQVC